MKDKGMKNKGWVKWLVVALVALLLEGVLFHLVYGLPLNGARVVAVVLIYVSGSFLFRLQRTPDYFK